MLGSVRKKGDKQKWLNSSAPWTAQRPDLTQTSILAQAWNLTREHPFTWLILYKMGICESLRMEGVITKSSSGIRQHIRTKYNQHACLKRLTVEPKDHVEVVHEPRHEKPSALHLTFCSHLFYICLSKYGGVLLSSSSRVKSAKIKQIICQINICVRS
ncbi:hypothetical protein CHARACLAT_016007 [Characodon lateralis]|uniref:Uncharacterized protein n=1 Tax=Characodon lateralis TaxID=208331 RepID=A0ABU7EU11_9TELE|nr:hypothetical protein [Characodon lateralis]